MDFEFLKASIKRSIVRFFLIVGTTLLLINAVGFFLPENEIATYIVIFVTLIIFTLLDKPKEEE